MKAIYKARTGFFALLALVLFTLQAKAQFTDDPTKTPQERAQILTSWMQDNLKLTDAQLKGITSINMKAATDMEAAKKEHAGNMQAFLDRGKEIEKDHNIKLRTALSPMQWSKYQKYRDGTLMGKDRKHKKNNKDKEEVAEEKPMPN
jgi:hypothetical protein